MPMEKTIAPPAIQDENAVHKRAKQQTKTSGATITALGQRTTRASAAAAAAASSSSNNNNKTTTIAATSRPALTNVTNTASASASVHPSSKVQKKVRSKTETATEVVQEEEDEEQTKGVKRTAEEQEHDPQTNVKRSKTEYEWEDLDADDMDDPLMVSEYVNEIFDYFFLLEVKTLPDSKYLEWQTGLKPKMRSILVDWIVEVHLRFRLLPETLFLAINIMDRFMSKEVVQVDRLQLLATGSLFIAAKYEEVYSPSVKNYSYVTDGGYTEEDILTAERYILQVLEFDLSYPNPMNFLRRISKADDYDIETRTVGKYLLEISIMDHRFIGIKPSLCAAAAMYVSRKMLGRSAWNGTLVHYSGGYTKADMRHVVEMLMKYLVEPVAHEEFFKKYASKKYMKSSILARHWAKLVVADGVDIMED